MTMRWWRLLLAALAMAVIGGGPIRSVGAQGEGGGELDFAGLDGVLEVVTRTYSIDFAALTATPGAGEDPASLEPEGVVTLLAYVAAFDGNDTAESAWETVNTEFASQAESLGDPETSEVETTEIDELGDRATSYTTTVPQGETTLVTAILVVRDARFVYIAIGITAGEDPVPTTTAVVDAMLATEAGTSGAERGDDGFYRGGPWDKFPVAGDEVLAGLEPLADEQVFPVGAATPDA